MTGEQVTLSEVAERWIASRSYRPASARQRRSILSRFIAHVGDRPIGDLTDAEVLSWWEGTAGLAPESRRARHAAVGGLMRWSVAMGYGGSTVLELVRRPPVPRTVPKVLSDDQVLDLQLEVFGTHPDELIVALMLHAGLRRAEVSALRGEDVNRRERLMTVHSKGGHLDVVPLPASVERLVPQGARGPLVGISPQGVARRALAAMHRAGIEGMTCHALRRTFATRLMHGGTPAVDVMRLMRHRSLGTTTRYVRSSFDA